MTIELQTVAMFLTAIAAGAGLLRGWQTFVRDQGVRGEKAAESVEEKVGRNHRDMDDRLRNLERSVAELPSPPSLRGLGEKIAGIDTRLATLETKIEGLTKEIELRDRSAEQKMDAISRNLSGVGDQVADLQKYLMENPNK